MRWYNDSQKKSLRINKKILLLLILPFVLIVSQNVFAVDVFQRPDSDTGNSFANTIGCLNADRWNCLNDIIPDDSTYIESDLIGVSNQDDEFLGLSDISDPLQSNGHVLNFRARLAGNGINSNALFVELLDSNGIITSTTINQGILTTTFKTFNYTLSNAEADSITDYSDLQVHLMTDCSGCTGGSDRDRTQVSWIQLAVLEDAPLVPPTLNTVTFIDGTTLGLNWSEPSSLSGILSYEIQRNGGSGYNNMANVPVGTTTYTDNMVIPNSFYTYRLLSVGASGTSNPSNSISQNTTVIIIESLFARPDTDTGQDWDNAKNCHPSVRWICVNEQNQDYGFSYLESDIIGVSNSDQEFLGLSDITVPQESLDHTIRFIAREAGLGSNQNSLLVELRESGVVIASVNIPQGGLSNDWALFEYTLSNSEVNSITDYSDLEVRLFTECESDCAGQSARDRTHISWIEFEVLLIPKPPPITDIDTINSTTMKIGWSIENLHEHIKRIIIQRSNGIEFETVGNVTNSTTTFTDTGLDPQKIYSFRLIGQGSFTNPSDILMGATPASIDDINGNGTILEPNPTNSLTKVQKEIFSQTIEHFNVTSSIINQIISDFDVTELNMYEVIVKMLNGSYDPSQQIINTGSYYGTRYVENLDIDQFLQTVTEEVKIALGNSNGIGDNIDFAKEAVGN